MADTMILLQLWVWSGPGLNAPWENKISVMERQEAWVSSAPTLAKALDGLEEYRELFAQLYNPGRKGTSITFRLLGIQTVPAIDDIRAAAVGVWHLERRIDALKEEIANA